MTTAQTGGGNGAAPDGGSGRKLPTRPGWWLAQFNDGPKPVEVVPFNGRLVVFFDSGAVDVETGWIASCWLAPIPGPAVLAALAEYGAAFMARDDDARAGGAYANGEVRRERIAADALHAAIRAERGGAA